MDWTSAAAPGRVLRLGYGLNLHAPRTLAELEAGLRAITLPLARRLATSHVDGTSPSFGVGMYLPAELALRLADPTHAAELARLRDLCVEHALAPFTFNAFPYGGFQTDGLKERVFAPAWDERARLDYTLAVARIAAELARATQLTFVSISTHTGAFGPLERGSARETACIQNFARAAWELARLRETGVWIQLALEPEPRASCGDQRELDGFAVRLFARGAEFLAREQRLSSARASELLRAHLGRCVDACHAAVEFEDERAFDGLEALACAKLQFTSALALSDPAHEHDARTALLALDEPRYLHQVTGRSPNGLVRVRDLGELARALEQRDARWLECDEWRCHFHVPVDLDRADDVRDARGALSGLRTTRPVADRLLRELLARAANSGAPELHVEIETYTWDVLPGSVRGPGALVDGLEREYRHVMGELERGRWRRASSGSPPAARQG